MKDSGHPVVFPPVDGRQLDGIARGNAEPAGGNLTQADLAFAQTPPEHVRAIGRRIQRLAVPVARCDADDETRRRP